MLDDKETEHAEDANTINPTCSCNSAKIYLEVIELKKTVNYLKELFESFIASSLPDNKIIKMDPQFINPDVPFKSVNEINLFNARCLDKYFLDQMTIRMHNTKKDTLKIKVRAILEKIYSVELLTKYSWSGRGFMSAGKSYLYVLFKTFIYIFYLFQFLKKK